MSRVIYFSMGALVLLAAVHASPVEKEEEDKSGWGWQPTTMAPGWGSGALNVSGDNAAFGQVISIQNMAGNQTQSAASTLEATAFYDYETSLFSGSSQNSQIEINTNSWAPGGGIAEVQDYTAVAESGGPYDAFNQGAALNNSVTIVGAGAAGIISNPQTSSAVSASSLVLSSSGQASNGTNVNPGAGGWGNSGWKAADEKDSKGGKKTRTQPQRSGWGSGGAVNQTGSSASSTSLASGTNISQAVSSSDNITAIAVQDYDEYTVGLVVEIQQPTGLELFVNGNGVAAGSEDTFAATQWQNFEVGSYPELNDTLVVADSASQAAVSIIPVSTTTFSIGNIAVSDWATASSGTNLVNQNNGGGSSSGWAPAAAPPSGWKAPLVEQMGYPVV